MPSINLGPAADLAVRLTYLEDQMRRLQQAPYGQAFSATQSDGSVGMQVFQDTAGAGGTATIWYQGPSTSRDPNTGMHPLLLYVGEVEVNGQLTDSTVLFYAVDGSKRAQIGGAVGTRFFDGKGNIIFNGDEVSGEGLAEPWLPLPMPVATGVGNWPKTNTSGTVAESVFRAQHPKVTWSGDGYCDAGTTGTVQVTITDSTGATVASGASHAVSSGAFASFSETVALPAGFWGQTYTVNVVASASGGGNTYAQLLSVYGRQS